MKWERMDEESWCLELDEDPRSSTTTTTRGTP
jgi:hypothetical protein